MKPMTRRKDNGRDVERAAAPPIGEDLRQRIAKKAYELYLNRGATHGRDLDDWLEAERTVLRAREQRAASQPPKLQSPARHPETGRRRPSEA